MTTAGALTTVGGRAALLTAGALATAAGPAALLTAAALAAVGGCAAAGLLAVGWRGIRGARLAGASA